MADDGRISFGVGVDLDGLESGAEESRRLFSEIAEAAREQGEALDATFASNAEEVSSVGREMESLAQSQRETGAAMDEATRSAEEQESVMVRLLGGTENYNAIMAALPAPIRSAIGAVEGLTDAAGKFIKTPVGAVIGAIVLALQALKQWFSRSAEGQEAFAKISGYVSGVLNQLMEIVLKVGKAIYGAFTDPKKALEDFVAALKKNVMNRFQAVGEMAGAVGKVIQSAFKFQWDDAKEGLADLGNAFLKFETGVDGLAGKVKDWASGVNDAAKETAAIKTESRQLELEVSAWQVRKQELDRMKAEASAKMYDTNASAEDRKKALDDYKAALQEQLDTEQSFADKRVELQQRRMAITTNADEDQMELDRLRAQAAAVETQGAQELASLTRRANSINRALGQETQDIVREGEARAKALEDLGKLTQSLMDANQAAELSLMEDGHGKRMAEIESAYRAELKKMEDMEKQFRDLNVAAGVETGDNGLTPEQEAQLTRMRENTEKSYRSDMQDILEDELADFLTYEQRRQKIEEDYAKRREALYTTDADGNSVLREGVTQGNIDELERGLQQELESVDRQFAQREETFNAWCDKISSMTLDDLERVLSEAEAALAEAEANGASGSTLAAARSSVSTAQKALDKANAKADTSPDKRSVEEWNDLREALDDCASSFKDIGDEIGGVAGDIVSSVGQIASKTVSAVNSIVQFVQVGVQGIKTAEEGGVSAMKAVEAASTIMAIIDAVMQVAMVIAGLFNNDSRIQEDIDRLQGQIDRLQWELDNLDAMRLQESVGDVTENIRKAYSEMVDEYARARGITAAMAELYISVWPKGTAAAEVYRGTVEKIADTYANVAYSADKAIGTDRYREARKELENYAEQLLLIDEMIEAENSKKKTDTEQITEWEQQQAEIAEEMNSLLNDMVEEIIGGSYEDIASKLGDAFVEAFQAGEDAAQAWADTVDDLVRDIVKNLLVQQYLEPEIAEIFDKYKDRWFPEGEYAGEDVVAANMREFSDDLNAASEQFAQAWGDIYEAMGWTADSSREATGKGIASASQESVDELNGRMTAIQGHTYAINENVAVIRATNSLILQSVVNIEDNTDRMLTAAQTVEDGVREIRSAVDDMATKGVKIR